MFFAMEFQVIRSQPRIFRKTCIIVQHYTYRKAWGNPNRLENTANFVHKAKIFHDVSIDKNRLRIGFFLMRAVIA